MTSGQKIAFSLLAALALFAVFVMSLHSKLFKELETRFYAQAKIEENTGQLDKISESCDSYISEILSYVEKGDNAWTKNASVRSYYVQNPSESDVNSRRRLTETLFSDIPALNGIRIVDKNGRNVHYSSFDDTDLLKQNGISKIYKNYPDIIKDADEIPFEQLQKITSETKSVLLFDEGRGRLIISVPFCWVDGIYSGLALFYLNLKEVENEFVRRNVVDMGQDFTLFADDDFNGGFVLNIPRASRNDFKNPVLSYWKARSQIARGGDDLQQPSKLLAMPDGRYYVGLSGNRIGIIRVSAVYTSDLFELSAEVRILIYICIFISILLFVFLIFSFIRDPMVTLQKRIKKIQLEIVENYIDGKEKREWNEVARHLRMRKNDLSDDIIKSLHVHSKKRRNELSDYLDKNWDEIFAIFETKTAAAGAAGTGTAPAANVSGAAELTGASIAEIRRMLEEVLQNRNLVVPAAGAAVAGAVAAKSAAPVDEVEDLDDAEELDEVEEIEDVEEAEEVDEVEDIDEAEEIDEVEELSEEAEETEEAEPVEEAEEVESLDEAEELEDAEELEEAEDAEEVEEVEELDDAEEVEDLDEAEEELDVLEEYVEPAPAAKQDSFDAFLKTMDVPVLDYKPSNDTFIASENFASVDNLFAEEIKLGDFSPFVVKNSSPIEIKFYHIPVYGQEDQAEEAETESEIEAEELTDEVPSYLSEPDFSMISFADNISSDVPELAAEAASPEKTPDAIVEKDGVFSIAENLQYTDVVQDSAFKNLVDSVLS